MNRRVNKTGIVFAILAVAAVLNGCIVKYSFTGASIPPAAKTFSVQYFPNNAMDVAPPLSNMLTEALRDRFSRQTRLTQVAEEGDFAIEGEITNQVTAPSAISAEERAAQNRVTVTVQVRFNNVVEPEWSFNKSFSAFADYDTNNDYQAIQNTLMEEIVTTLVDNIFNACASNW